MDDSVAGPLTEKLTPTFARGCRLLPVTWTTRGAPKGWFAGELCWSPETLVSAVIWIFVFTVKVATEPVLPSAALTVNCEVAAAESVRVVCARPEALVVTVVAPRLAPAVGDTLKVTVAPETGTVPVESVTLTTSGLEV